MPADKIRELNHETGLVLASRFFIGLLVTPLKRARRWSGCGHPELPILINMLLLAPVLPAPRNAMQHVRDGFTSLLPVVAVR